MKIEKRYWIWNPELNNTDYKLGSPIEPFVSKGLVKELEKDEYTTENEEPWFIRTKSGIITDVFFRDNGIILLKDKSIWDKELRLFCDEMDQLLTPSSINEKGKFLMVVFKDFFVSFAGIQER